MIKYAVRISRIVALMLWSLFHVVDSASAQFSIDGTSFINSIGTSYRILIDDTSQPAVDLGAAGENQTWDFSGLSLTGAEVDFSFLAPGQTPYGDDFPEADGAVYSESDSYEGYVIYSFIDFEGDDFEQLGTVLASTVNSDFQLVYTPDEQRIPLPVTYGSIFSHAERDTMGSPAVQGLITIDSTYSVVDGWGTLILPIGSYAALRIKEEENFITQAYIGGTLVSQTTQVTHRYEWYAPPFQNVLSINETFGGGNPNFNQAESVEMLIAVTTAREERLPTPDLTSVLQVYDNYPNPFTERTTIDFELDKPDQVSVSVYNVVGKRVASLLEASLPQGRHKAVWDASGFAAGIYFYRLETGSVMETRQMVLLR